ncbi:MAG: acetylglutamate kinase [Mucilaginibacter polytrichastri]|nr:acetylglutamate kinase [Mucilaginibacter polytrichastri]
MNREKLYVIKIGGNVIDNPAALKSFLADFAAINSHKILVHGGGKAATALLPKMGIEPKMTGGRRITDQPTLDVVTMVYAGLISKNVVAQLQSLNCNAVGLSGADGNFIHARKRPVKEIDYGFAGDLDENSVNAGGISRLIDADFTPVFSAITHDKTGQLLNTNADTIASALAVGLSSHYETQLVYCFEKKGVLRDVHDDDSVITQIASAELAALTEKGIIAEGMLPKLQNAFSAIEKGVQKVLIGHAADLRLLEKDSPFGTTLSA